MQVQLDDYTAGAILATDLVNTAPEVMTSTGDALADPAALHRFLADHDLPARDVTPVDVLAVHALRDALRDAIGAPDGDAAMQATTAVAAGIGRGPLLRRDASGRAHWWLSTSADATVADELALRTATALLGVLRALGHPRFRACAAPDCLGAFVDTSRAGRRRYCVPEVCGNRVNVANHRRRRRGTTEGAIR